MEIRKPAVAGTLESSDAQVTIEPLKEAAENAIELSVQSSVLGSYGRLIRETVLETLHRLGVESADVRVVDHGALDCTLRARVECAVFRAAEQNADYPWGGVIRQ